MKHYEMFCVLPGTLGEDEVTAVVDNVSQVLGSLEASGVTREDMGKSRLAYPIKHIRYGYFQLFRFELESENLAKLENNVRLLDNLLRVVVRTSDPSKAKAYTLAQDPTALSAPQKSDEDERGKKKSFEKRDHSRSDNTRSTKEVEKKEVVEEKVVEEKKIEEVAVKEVVEEKKESIEEIVEKPSEVKKATADKAKISIDDIDQKLDEILQKDIDNV